MTCSWGPSPRLARGRSRVEPRSPWARCVRFFPLPLYSFLLQVNHCPIVPRNFLQYWCVQDHLLRGGGGGEYTKIIKRGQNWANFTSFSEFEEDFSSQSSPQHAIAAGMTIICKLLLVLYFQDSSDDRGCTRRGHGVIGAHFAKVTPNFGFLAAFGGYS